MILFPYATARPARLSQRKESRSSDICIISQSLSDVKTTVHDALTSNQPGNGKPSYDELEKDYLKLKKELGYVNEINKILKKAQQSSQTARWEVCGD